METFNSSNKTIKKNENTSSIYNLIENNNSQIGKILNNTVKIFQINQNKEEKNIENDKKETLNIISNNNTYNTNNFKNSKIKLKIFDDNSKFYLKEILPFPSIKKNNSDDFLNQFLNLKTENKILYLSSQLENNIWFRGKIKKIKLINNKTVFQYYEDKYNIFLMSALKKGRKSYKIFSDQNLFNKIGSMSINFIGNIFNIKMDNNEQNKCQIKYVKILILLYRILIFLV